MITYTGTHVTKEFGAPNIRDMAVQSMRIVRFVGAYEKFFWPVGMHSLLVADLGPKEIEHHLLLHDVGSEVIVNDHPRPMKTGESRVLEGTVLARTYWLLGIPLPTEEEAKLIHEADMEAVMAEGAMGCGPRGFCETQSNFKWTAKSEKALNVYLDEYNPLDYLNADGKWSLHFERRLRRALRDAQHINYHKSA